MIATFLAVTLMGVLKTIYGAAVVVGVIVGACLLPPVKWVWRKLVSDPVTQWAAKVSKVSKSTEVGTGTGFFDIAGGGSTYPTVPFWVGIHNPSSNAGHVTILSTNAINARTGRKSLLGRAAFNAVSQGTTPPSSVSTYTYGTTATSTVFEPNEYAPIIYSRGT